jgi:2-polyprenyl-6-methoxyphenol hydroxylase-like FAD-dependent oxidoreductase
MVNNNRQYDVVISGAGPVGLFLACELALKKCFVLVLEKMESPNSPLKKIPFGIRGLSAPTIEALNRRDLLSELKIHKRMKSPHANAEQGPRRQVGHFAGIPFRDGDIDLAQWPYRLQSSTPPSLITEMEELETVLTKRANSLGVEIKYGFPVSDFQKTNDRVTVQANEQTFKGQWLVGCDGSRSVVRKLGGFEFAGTEPEFTGYTTKLDLIDPEKLKPGRNSTSKGMYMQSQPGYVVIQDFDGGKFHGSQKPLTLEHVQAVLRKVSDTDITISALHIATTWTDRARQATSYRNGRVFLAGDAAHIHSPLGGQGLNLGMGDAMNLGWKLASVIQNISPEGLLDTYHSERHPIGVRVLEWSRAQVAIMQPDPKGQALNTIIRDLMNTRDGATYFAGRVWGIFTNYNLSDEHPIIGHSVPNFEFEDGKKIDEYLRDGRGILLDFNKDDSLKILANNYKEQIKYISGPAKEQFGLSTLLIRPDGIIAWVSNGKPNIESLRKTSDLWFHRQ